MPVKVFIASSVNPKSKENRFERLLLMCVFVRYHLKDVIVGKIYFLLVRIKIQHMELQLIKKEITGIGKSPGE